MMRSWLVRFFTKPSARQSCGIRDAGKSSPTGAVTGFYPMPFIDVSKVGYD